MSDSLQRREREERQLAMRLDECEGRIERAQRSADLHGIFALLGVSPASVLPMIGLGIDFGMSALIGASVVVGGLESWRWIRARRELKEALAERIRILEKIESGGTDPG